jgi:predicted transcriptional regulator
MKTTKNISKALTFTLFAFLTLTISQTGFAGITDSTPVELKFVGNMKNQPVFQLDLHNKLAGEYNIQIKDANNEVIYSETLKGTEISRKYQFLTDEVDARTLQFEITDKKDNTSVIYSVNRQTRTVQDLVINKLK